MITKEQQLILNTIKGKLENLNQTELPQGGLIDVGGMLSEFNIAEKRHAEIKINNEAFEQVRVELLMQSIDTLNADLKELGMVAKHNDYKSCIIISDIQGRECWTKNLMIDVIIDKDYEHVGNVANVYVSIGVRFKFKDNIYHTLEALINANNENPKWVGGFKYRLMNFYHELNSQKVA
jgi:hypothetical protein